MRGMQQQLGNLGTISAFACRHRETKKNMCRGGRSQDLPDTEIKILYINTQNINQQLRSLHLYQSARGTDYGCAGPITLISVQRSNFTSFVHSVVSLTKDFTSIIKNLESNTNDTNVIVTDSLCFLFFYSKLCEAVRVLGTSVRTNTRTDGWIAYIHQWMYLSFHISKD